MLSEEQEDSKIALSWKNKMEEKHAADVAPMDALHLSQEAMPLRSPFEGSGKSTRARKKHSGMEISAAGASAEQQVTDWDRITYDTIPSRHQERLLREVLKAIMVRCCEDQEVQDNSNRRQEGDDDASGMSAPRATNMYQVMLEQYRAVMLEFAKSKAVKQSFPLPAPSRQAGSSLAEVGPDVVASLQRQLYTAEADRDALHTQLEDLHSAHASLQRELHASYEQYQLLQQQHLAALQKLPK